VGQQSWRDVLRQFFKAKKSKTYFVEFFIWKPWFSILFSTRPGQVFMVFMQVATGKPDQSWRATRLNPFDPVAFFLNKNCWKIPFRSKSRSLYLANMNTDLALFFVHLVLMKFFSFRIHSIYFLTFFSWPRINIRARDSNLFLRILKRSGSFFPSSGGKRQTSRSTSFFRDLTLEGMSFVFNFQAILVR
jgi:hypothetical protein